MKRLFSLLGVFGLLGIPALSYGEWRQNSGWLWADPDERSCEDSNCYKGDCREMMCQYGCIEDPAGKGHCASSGQSGEVCYGGLGCQEGLVCSSLTDMGICTGACPEHSSTTESSWQIGETGCYCNEDFIVNNEGTGCITAPMQCEVYLNNATYANKCSTSVHSLPYEVKLNGNIWSFPGMGVYHLAGAKVICYYSNGKSETFFDTFSGAGNFRTYNNTTVCTIPAGESLTRIYFYGSLGIYVYATNSNSMPAVFTFVPKNE